MWKTAFKKFTYSTLHYSVSDDVLKIDLEDPDILKDFDLFMHNVWPIYNIIHEWVNSIFIGVMTKQYTRDNDITENSEYKISVIMSNINASVKK